MTRPLGTFHELRSQYGDPEDDIVPGVPRGRERPHRSGRHAEEWDGSPLKYEVRGTYYEFFTIGALAKAINRSPVSIRRWEDMGVFPKARFRAPKRLGAKTGQRLYTRRQIKGIVKIAAEEGVGQDRKLTSFQDTKFPQRAAKLFMETATLGPEDEARE